MPDAYKDVDVVVAAVEEARLANRVARLKPHLVMKG
jgi:tRNA-splicing ligase RtcB